jgi:DNA polymerase III delta prime subunit
MKYKLHFVEQDHLFKAIQLIGLDYIKDNTSNSIIDSRKHLVRRRHSEEEGIEGPKKQQHNFLRGLPEGKSILEYKGEILEANIFVHYKPINIMEHMTFKIDFTIECDKSLEFLNDFCEHCYGIYEKRILNKKEQKGTVTHFIWDENYWDDIARRKKRSLSTISLENTGEELLAEIRDFLSPETEKLYETLGVNYKKNYLFEGVPGTGKTSLIFTLASELDLDIAILHFDSKLTDVRFMQAIQRMPKKSILVIEDVDHLFIERKKNDELKNAITFSGILNVLDGFGSLHKQLTFITTNHECILDSAFKRPGRIDRTVHFDYSTKIQIEHMFNRFLPNQMDNFKNFYKKIKHCKITTAVLQTFLFQWRECENIIDHVDELIKLAGKNEYNKNGVNMFS